MHRRNLLAIALLVAVLLIAAPLGGCTRPTPTAPLPTSAPESEDTPTPATQGERIAFTSNRDGNDFEIYVMNADGSDQTRLTNNPEQNSAEPAWSPDGSRIAFLSGCDGDWEIYTMSADGSDQIRLTNSPGDDIHPAWSPDGSRIAFVSGRDGNFEIYVMSADGSGQTRLTNNPEQNSAEPALVAGRQPYRLRVRPRWQL